MAGNVQAVREALKAGEGIVRLAPNWVPRSFCIPGKRLKLHPDDYYAFGAHRGGIDERWFASTTKADNGPETLEDEGLSYIVTPGGHKVLLREAIEAIGDEILGQEVMRVHGGWTMYSKFFDNLEPLPHHLHHTDEKAALVGMRGKPEAYYFPKQLNNKRGYFPYTFFGLNPGVTRQQVRSTLERWHKGDNGILELSRAYKLVPGTGVGCSAGVASRARLVLDLRTAACVRRFCDVSVDRVGRLHPVGTAGQERPRRPQARPRRYHELDRLGPERRP